MRYKPLFRRSHLGALTLLLLAAACSHEEPFIRGGLPSEGPPTPSPEQIQQRIILIGDAGAPSVDGEPVLTALRGVASALPEKTVVVFLGDNIYPAGLPAEDAPGRRDAERALTAQLAAAGSAQTVFIAGNHDWGFSPGEGTASLRRQADWLRERSAQLSPNPGCPGPGVHDFAGARLVTLDTQWWLQSAEERGTCSRGLTQFAQASIEGALSPEDSRPVIVVGHHPLMSRGPHGGFYTLAEWLVPSRPDSRRWRQVLPPLPGQRPLWRWFQPSNQDFVSAENAQLRGRIGSALASNPPLVYASGHEHSLQVFDGGPFASLLLVSGAGSSSNATPVGHDRQTLFAHQSPGFMVVDVLEDRALLRVIEPGSNAVPYWREVELRD